MLRPVASAKRQSSCSTTCAESLPAHGPAHDHLVQGDRCVIAGEPMRDSQPHQTIPSVELVQRGDGWSAADGEMLEEAAARVGGACSRQPHDHVLDMAGGRLPLQGSRHSQRGELGQERLSLSRPLAIDQSLQRVLESAGLIQVQVGLVLVFVAETVDCDNAAGEDAPHPRCGTDTLGRQLAQWWC